MYGSLRKNNGIRQHGISLFTDHYDHDSGNHRRGKSTACKGNLDLYEAGFGEQIEGMVKELFAGGDTCGFLTGSACAIGYFLGNLAPEEKEDTQMKPAVQELYQWFRQKTEEEFGAFYCKDITHLDWGIIMEKCPGLIADTYTKVMEILTEREVLEL